MKKSIITLSILLSWCAKDHKTLAQEPNLQPTSQNQNQEIVQAINVSSSCPSDMIEVEGNYCPVVKKKCLRWLDKNQSPSANQGEGPLRCAEFQYPTKCLSKKRIHEHF